MVAWVVSAVALLVAVAALALIRRQARQLESLTRSYWELRYDYTRLRSRLSRLDPEGDPSGPREPDADPSADSAQNTQGSPAGAPSVTYVPLSTIRKKEH